MFSRSLRHDGEQPSGPDGNLWRAIRTFPLDEPGATLPFTRRLARDHLSGESRL